MVALLKTRDKEGRNVVACRDAIPTEKAVADLDVRANMNNTDDITERTATAGVQRVWRVVADEGGALRMV